MLTIRTSLHDLARAAQFFARFAESAASSASLIGAIMKTTLEATPVALQTTIKPTITKKSETTK